MKLTGIRFRESDCPALALLDDGLHAFPINCENSKKSN